MFYVFVVSTIGIGLICAVICFFKKENRKILAKAALAMWICEFLFFAYFPLPSFLFEDVWIEALDSKNEMSSGGDVFIRNMTLGNFSQNKFPEVTEGKWIWLSEMYGWTASVPYELSRKIKIEMPVGRGRDIVFMGSPWAGNATISNEDFFLTIDCYSPEVIDVVIRIPDTEKKKILLNYALQILGIVSLNIGISFIVCLIRSKGGRRIAQK